MAPLVPSGRLSGSHEGLVVDDDGSWQCSTCKRQGSPYTLPGRQPCSPVPNDPSASLLAFSREIIEESLVGRGYSPEIVDRVLATAWLDEWVAALRLLSIPITGLWLNTSSPSLEGRTPLEAISGTTPAEVWDILLGTGD